MFVIAATSIPTTTTTRFEGSLRLTGFYKFWKLNQLASVVMAATKGSVAMATSVSVVAVKAVQAVMALGKPRKTLSALQTLATRMDLMWW